MKEIERKFLVDKELWGNLTKPKPHVIIQAYILNSPEKTVRVRIKNNEAYLTIKGATKGISRSEFEYKIPIEDAKILIHDFADTTLSKDRYEIQIGKHLWEVDVFHDKLNGLIVAEIELESEDESFEKPNWITKEVSHDPAYYNANLIKRL